MRFVQAAAGNAAEGLKGVATSLPESLIDNPVNALLNANYVGILVWAAVIGTALKKDGFSRNEKHDRPICGSVDDGRAPDHLFRAGRLKNGEKMPEI